MANRNLEAEMRTHAEAAVEMVFEEFGHRLDFSEATVGAVESILNGFWKEGCLTDGLISNITLLFGAYLGELIRKAFPDARWIQHEFPSANSPAIVLDDIQLFPLAWCYKRLFNGPEDSVVKKYLAFREVVDARL